MCHQKGRSSADAHVRDADGRTNVKSHEMTPEPASANANAPTSMALPRRMRIRFGGVLWRCGDLRRSGGFHDRGFGDIRHSRRQRARQAIEKSEEHTSELQ